MKILQTSFNGNPNIGLLGLATNQYCLLGYEVSEQQATDIEAVLKVPVYRLSIAGTSLVGVFCAANSHTLLVPSIVMDHERETLDSLEIEYQIIRGKMTALGNSILLNDNGAALNPELEDDQLRDIRKKLDLPSECLKLADLPTIGSLGVSNSIGTLLARDSSPEERAAIERLLKTECNPGTVNQGSNHVRSAIICNDHGLIIGDRSRGLEAGTAFESLFLKEEGGEDA